MADFTLLLEAEKRGILPADKMPLLAEARKRGLIPGSVTEPSSPGVSLGETTAFPDALPPPRGILPVLGGIGAGGMALAATGNPVAAYMAGVGGAGAGSVAEDWLHGEPAGEEMAKRALGSMIGQGIAPGVGASAERLAMPGAKTITQEARAAYEYARRNNLPIDVSEVSPSWVTSLFSGDIFAAGRYKTKQYAKTANDYLIGLRSKVLQNLTGAEETATIPLAAVPGKVKPALKLKTREAYEEPLIIVKEQMGDVDAVVRLENMRRTAGEMLGDVRVQNAKKGKWAPAAPKDWLEDFLNNTGGKIDDVIAREPKWHSLGSNARKEFYDSEAIKGQGNYRVWDWDNREWEVFKSKAEEASFRERNPYINLQERAAGEEKIWYRYGKPPGSGASMNVQTGASEGGVSVYATPEGSGGAVFFADRNVYSGPGRQVGWGSDGEPIVIVTGTWNKVAPAGAQTAKKVGGAKFSDVHKLQSEINRVFYGATNEGGAPLLSSLADDLVKWDAAVGQQLNEAYTLARGASKNEKLFDSVYSVLRAATKVDQQSGAEMLNGAVLKSKLQTPAKGLRGMTPEKNIIEKLGKEEGQKIIDDLYAIADYATHTRGMRAKEGMPILDPTTIISGGAGPAAGSMLNVGGPVAGVLVPQGSSLALTIALTGPGKKGFLRNWLLKEGHPALKMGTRLGVQFGVEQTK